MNESYHISIFRSLREFTDKLPFVWHLLNCKLPKRGRKLLAWCLYFNTWTLCFYKERSVSVFRHVSVSCLRNVYCLNLAFDSRRKNDISGYIWPRSFNQTVKCSLLDEKIVYQSFFGAPLTFSCFFFKEKFCVSHASASRSLARCLLSSVSKTLSKKLYLQLYLMQIVHSNGKKLFAWRKNCLSKFLWWVAHV